MSRMIEVTLLPRDGIQEGGPMLIASDAVIRVKTEAFWGQPSTRIVTSETVMGSSSAFWVKESYEEVKAKLCSAQREPSCSEGASG
jgi:hypothetical protein